MSLHAVAWALEHPLVGNPRTKLVLIGLAEHANDVDPIAWPSLDRLRRYACCSRSSVRRCLDELIELDIIEPGPESAVEYLRPDRRPNVWRLPALAQRGITLTPREDERDTKNDATGYQNETSRGTTAMTPEPKEEPKEEPTRPRVSRTQGAYVCRRCGAVVVPPERHAADCRPVPRRVAVDGVAQVREALVDARAEEAS